MPAPAPPEWTIDVDDDRQAGLLDNEDFSRRTIPRFVRDDVRRRRLRFVRQTLSGPEDIDMTDAVVEMALGDRTADGFVWVPIGFVDTVDGGSLGFVMVNPPSEDVDGGAWIRLTGGTIVSPPVVRQVDVDTAGGADPHILVDVALPAGCPTAAVELRTGTDYYAYSNDFEVVADGTLTSTQVRVGTADLPETWRIAMSESPAGGAWTISWEPNTGPTKTAVLPYNVTADDLAAALGDLWTVTQTGDFQWDLVYTAVGALDNPVVIDDDSALVWASRVEGTLSTATDTLDEKFAAITEDEFTTTVEIRVTWPDAEAEVVFHAPVEVVRNLIE